MRFAYCHRKWAIGRPLRPFDKHQCFVVASETQ